MLVSGEDLHAVPPRVEGTHSRKAKMAEDTGRDQAEALIKGPTLEMATSVYHTLLPKAPPPPSQH